MKSVRWIGCVLLSVISNAYADAATEDCEAPKNRARELPSEIGREIPSNDGVESFIALPLTGDPIALVLVTAPQWSFACNAVQPKGASTSRRVLFWAKNSGNNWAEVDFIDNPNVIWPLDTYGSVSVYFVRDGDSTFRLQQESAFQRTSFSDSLSFQYGSNQRFRITSWVSNSRYVGMYGGGPMDSYEGFEAKLKANPEISDFDGYEGKIDYAKRTGLFTKYKFEEIPVTRQLTNIVEPFTLKDLRNRFFMPSFDCTMATTKAERTICDDKQLSEADVELADLFKRVKKSHDKEHRQKLIGDQRTWLAQRESICFGKGTPDDESAQQKCLARVYDERRRELRILLKSHKAQR